MVLGGYEAPFAFLSEADGNDFSWCFQRRRFETASSRVSPGEETYRMVQTTINCYCQMLLKFAIGQNCFFSRYQRNENGSFDVKRDTRYLYRYLVLGCIPVLCQTYDVAGFRNSTATKPYYQTLPVLRSTGT